MLLDANEHITLIHIYSINLTDNNFQWILLCLRNNTAVHQIVHFALSGVRKVGTPGTRGPSGGLGGREDGVPGVPGCWALQARLGHLAELGQTWALRR